MFITFEGIDLSGKSTQIALLEKFLKKQKEKVTLVREPGGTKISEKIRDVLLDKGHHMMDDTTEFLLFSASRRQLTHQLILPALSKGRFVLSDRYYDSSTAYQGYGGGLDLNMIKMINRIASAGLEPAVTFLLDIDIDCWLSRKKIRSGSADRIESKKIAYYKRVIAGYRKLAKLNRKRFVVVDGEHDRNTIHGLIAGHIQKFLKVKS